MQEFNLEYKGILYTIQKDTSESIDVFLKRAWYIVKKNPTTIQELNKYIELSLIWSNHHFHGVSYSSKIMNMI